MRPKDLLRRCEPARSGGVRPCDLRRAPHRISELAAADLDDPAGAADLLLLRRESRRLVRLAAGLVCQLSRFGIERERVAFLRVLDGLAALRDAVVGRRDLIRVDGVELPPRDLGIPEDEGLPADHLALAGSWRAPGRPSIADLRAGNEARSLDHLHASMVSRLASPLVTPCGTDVLRPGTAGVPRATLGHLPSVALHELPEPRLRRVAPSPSRFRVPSVDDDRVGDRAERTRRGKWRRPSRDRHRIPRGHRSARRRSSRAPLEAQGPVLADQGLTERVVAFAFDEPEPRTLVDPSCRDKDVIRPEGELAVSGRAREADAFVDEA